MYTVQSSTWASYSPTFPLAEELATRLASNWIAAGKGSHTKNLLEVSLFVSPILPCLALHSKKA